jgi:tripeptidyl-peptidase-1
VGVVVLLAAAASAAGVTIRRGTVTPTRNGWVSTDQRSAGDELVELRVELKQRNLDELERRFWSVSDPTSPDYGKFMTLPQLRDLISPPSSHVRAVREWLQSGEPTSVEVVPTGDYIKVTMSVSAAERLFGVELVRYVRIKEGREASRSILRAREQKYILPMHIAGLIYSVAGLIDFPPLVKPRPMADEPGISITPAIIKNLYKIGSAVGKADNNSQAVAEFEQEYFYPSDIPIFQKKFDLPLKNISRIVGRNQPNTGYLGEASLDTEYMMAVANNVPTWVFYQDSFDLVEWGIKIASTPGAPLIHSVSYGSGESSYEADTKSRVNVEFQKLGLLGFSLLASSGDDGTGNTGTFWCVTFDANFPASSPYITAVGGTYLTAQTGGTEIGWPGSGGGFSAYYPQPSYQSAAVKQYLQQSGLPNAEYYNASGRALPDVSALSTNFEVVIQGLWGPISGTSAAAPTFAAIVTLLNDARYQAGKGPLGFLNPFLYQVGRIGFDVTQGNNVNSWCSAGFPATPGWDAITGLGTPDYQVLLSAALRV